MKKFFISNIFSIFFNIFLFAFLLTAIQNNHQKKVINIFNFETVELPISFILGSSFIAGSICGNLIFSILKFKVSED
tara:strand:+ start:91 stop:321 length:231 start_codon:yes stop_codon:yes gene_type:complete